MTEFDPTRTLVSFMNASTSGAPCGRSELVSCRPRTRPSVLHQVMGPQHGPITAISVRKLSAGSWMLIESKRFAPRCMTETLDEEVEKGIHFRHAMPTLRVDRREGHLFSGITFGQYWL